MNILESIMHATQAIKNYTDTLVTGKEDKNNKLEIGDVQDPDETYKYPDKDHYMSVGSSVVYDALKAEQTQQNTLRKLAAALYDYNLEEEYVDYFYFLCNQDPNDYETVKNLPQYWHGWYMNKNGDPYDSLFDIYLGIEWYYNPDTHKWEKDEAYPYTWIDSKYPDGFIAVQLTFDGNNFKRYGFMQDQMDIGFNEIHTYASYANFIITLIYLNRIYRVSYCDNNKVEFISFELVDSKIGEHRIILKKDNSVEIVDTVAGEGGTTIESLNDISDVEITDAENGQSLVYENGKWINKLVQGGESSGYTETILFDYRVDDVDKIIRYDNSHLVLRDSISNYDAVAIEFVSLVDDISSDSWKGTSMALFNVKALINSYNSRYVNFTTFGERSSRLYFGENEIYTTIRNLNNTNGIVKVIGIKYGCGSSKTEIKSQIYTSTTPRITSSSSISEAFADYMAFNGVSADPYTCQNGWLAAASDSSPYIQYEFDEAINLSSIIIETCNNSTAHTVSIDIQGSDDGVNFETIKTDSLSFPYGLATSSFIFVNTKPYRFYRIQGSETFYKGINATACTFSKIDITGYVDEKVNVDWNDIVNKPINLMYSSDNSETMPDVSIVDNAGVYSLEEQVIGKWMGKPLYRRTFLTTSPSNSSWLTWEDLSNQFNLAGIDPHNIRKMDAIAYSIVDGRKVCTPLNVWVDDMYKFQMLIYGNEIRGTIGSYAINSPTYFTFEYTKED